MSTDFNYEVEIKAAVDALNARNWEEAEQRAKNALQVNKKDERGYRHAATAAVNLGADERAHKYLVLGTNRCPTSAPLAKALEQLTIRQNAHKQDLADLMTSSFETKQTPTIAQNEKKKETAGIVLKRSPHQSMFALLQEGSEALNLQHYLTAIECYRKALEAAKNSPAEERPERARKYALSLARVGLGTYDSLCTAIDALLEIKGKTFPAAFYGLAIAYEKLNRFKAGLEVTQEGLKLVLDFDLDWETYCWPGQNKPIEESRRSVLKVKLSDLASKFRLPPKPDGVCRLPECLQLSSHILPCTNIYHTDPDFVGYVIAACEEKCRVVYHIPCWKHFKETVANLAKVSDKDMLGRPCPTEGCRTGFYNPRHSIIIKLTVIGADNNIKAEVEGDRSEDPVPPPVPVTASPTKKLSQSESLLRKRQGEKTSNAGATKKAAQKVQQASTASHFKKPAAPSQAQLQIVSCENAGDSDHEYLLPDNSEFDSDEENEDAEDGTQDYYFLEEKDGEGEEYDAKFVDLLLDSAAWAWRDERETYNFNLKKEEICDPRLMYFGNESFKNLRTYLSEKEETESPDVKEQKSKLRKRFYEYLQKHGPTHRSVIVKQIKDWGYCKDGDYFLQDEIGVFSFLLDCPLFACIDDKLCTAENVDQLYSSIAGPIYKFLSSLSDSQSSSKQEGGIFEDADYDDDSDFPDEEAQQDIQEKIDEDELNAEMMKMSEAEIQYLNAQKEVINNHDISNSKNDTNIEEATPSTSKSFAASLKQGVDLLMKNNDKVKNETPKAENNTILNEENLKFLNPFPDNDPTFEVERELSLQENDSSSVNMGGSIDHKNEENLSENLTTDNNKETEIGEGEKCLVQNSHDILFESDSETANETDEEMKSPDETETNNDEKMKVEEEVTPTVDEEEALENLEDKTSDKRLCPSAKTFLCPTIEPFTPTGQNTPPLIEAAKIDDYPSWSTADMVFPVQPWVSRIHLAGQAEPLRTRVPSPFRNWRTQVAGAATAVVEPGVPTWSGENLDDNNDDPSQMELKKAYRVAKDQVAALNLKELNLTMELEERERQLSDEKEANRNLARRLEEQVQRHRKAQEALQASAIAEAALRERLHLEQREKALNNAKVQKALAEQLKSENAALKEALEKSNTQVAPTKSQLLACQKRMLQLLESHWSDVTRHYNDTAVRNVAQMYTAVRHLSEDSTPSTRFIYQSIEQWENTISKIAETGDKFKKILEGHEKQIKAGKPADKKLNALIIPSLPKMPDYPMASIIDKDLQTVGNLFGGKNKPQCSVATQTKIKAVEPSATFNQTRGMENTAAFSQARGMENAVTFSQARGMENADRFTSAGFNMMTGMEAFNQARGMENAAAFSQAIGMENPASFSQTRGMENPASFSQTRGMENPASFSQTRGMENPASFSQTRGMENPASFSQTRGMENAATLNQTRGMENTDRFTSGGFNMMTGMEAFNQQSSQYVPPSLSTLAAAAGGPSSSSAASYYQSGASATGYAPPTQAQSANARDTYSSSPSLMNLLKPKPTHPVKSHAYYSSAFTSAQVPKPTPTPVLSKPSKAKNPPTMADALKGPQLPNIPPSAASKLIPQLKAKSSSSSGKRSNYKVLIEDLVEANFHVSESQVCDAIKVVRERNNNKLTGLSKEDIYRRVSEVLVEFLMERSPAELKPVPEGLLEGAYGDGEEDVCCICMEEQNMVQGEIFLLPCKHTFHSTCIHNWLLQENFCPMCRQIVMQVYANKSEEFPPLRH